MTAASLNPVRFSESIVSTSIPQLRFASALFFTLVPVTAILNTGSIRILAVLLYSVGLLLWTTGNYTTVTADSAGLRKCTLLSDFLRKIGFRAPKFTMLAWEDIHRVACILDDRQPLGWKLFPSGTLMLLGFSTQIEIPFRSTRFSDLCSIIRDHIDETRLDFYFRRINYLKSRSYLKRLDKEILSKGGNSTELLQVGYGYCLWGDYPKAKEYLEIASRRDPSNSELKGDLAEILLFAGEVERGLRLQDEVADRFPQDAGPIVRQGHLLLAIEERKKAISCFLKGTCLPISPDTAHLALSLVYEDMGIEGLARSHFQSASEKTQDLRLRAHLNAWRHYRDRLARDERFSQREMRRLRRFQTERRLRRGVYWLFIAALVANGANFIKIAVSGQGIVPPGAMPLLWILLCVVSGLLFSLWIVRRLD